MPLRLFAAVAAVFVLVAPGHAWLPFPDSTGMMVFFDAQRHELTARAVEVLGRAAGMANGRYDGAVVVNGHADLAEGDSLALSTARALAVRDKLAELGVAPERLVVGAFGRRLRLVIDQAGAPEAANRRVEIELVRLCKPNCPEERFPGSGSSRD